MLQKRQRNKAKIYAPWVLHYYVDVDIYNEHLFMDKIEVRGKVNNEHELECGAICPECSSYVECDSCEKRKTAQIKEMKKYPRKWESVIGDRGHGLMRLRVPGGWHVITEKCLIYYPDPNYEWVLEEETDAN